MYHLFLLPTLKKKLQQLGMLLTLLSMPLFAAENTTIIDQIDQHVNTYYTSLNIPYLDADGNGKFKNFCIGNDIDDETVVEELKESPDDCMLVDFDEDFPFVHESLSQLQKESKNKPQTEKQKHSPYTVNGSKNEFILNFLKSYNNPPQTLSLLSSSKKSGNPRPPQQISQAQNQLQVEIFEKPAKSTTIINKIEYELEKYYQTLGKSYLIYKGEHGNLKTGKFARFCSVNKMYDNEVVAQLQKSPQECMLVHFDNHFPHRANIGYSRNIDKRELILKLLRKYHLKLIQEHCDKKEKMCYDFNYNRSKYAFLFEKKKLIISSNDKEAIIKIIEASDYIKASGYDIPWLVKFTDKNEKGYEILGPVVIHIEPVGHLLNSDDTDDDTDDEDYHKKKKEEKEEEKCDISKYNTLLKALKRIEYGMKNIDIWEHYLFLLDLSFFGRINFSIGVSSLSGTRADYDPEGSNSLANTSPKFKEYMRVQQLICFQQDLLQLIKFGLFKQQICCCKKSLRKYFGDKRYCYFQNDDLYIIEQIIRASGFEEKEKINMGLLVKVIEELIREKAYLDIHH
ncbi:MAG: hypothetical protein AAF335_03085 [Bacteroidota bacterium]